MIGEKIVVLDRIASRYFLAPAGAVGPSSAPPPHDHQTVLLSWEGDQPPHRDTARQRWITSVATEGANLDVHPGLLALWRLRRLEWKCAGVLRRGGIDAGLRLLESCSPGELRQPAILKLVAASRASTQLWRSRDQCLPRSLALTYALRAVGSAAQLFLGVTLYPFTAHAWVQDGDKVLNDTLDQVRLFKPILVA